MIVQPYDIMSGQVILGNGSSNFMLGIINGNFVLTIDGNTQILGAASKEYQHIALILDANTNSVQYYNEGNLINTISYSGISGDWSNDNWRLGVNDDVVKEELIMETLIYYITLISMKHQETPYIILEQ